MLRFEQGIQYVSMLQQFQGSKTFDVAPPNALRWYYDQAAQNLVISRNGGAYLPIGGSSDAAAWNVPGDGVTDATTALLALIAIGDAITLEAGATYLVSRPLTLQAGQILYGNGATLKRAAQVSSTTTTATTSGVTTTITVASAASFAVGMSVVLVNGASYDSTQHTITGISGNAITVNTPWQVTFSGTSTLYQAGDLLIAGTDGRVYDLKIDGNRAAWTYAKWYHTTDLRFGGARALFEGCHVQNSPGEAIQASASIDDLRLIGCKVTNANGNGVHYGGNNRCRVIGCAFENTNLDVNVEHADGCISWSNTVEDMLILGCFMKNGKSGIGSIDQVDNSDLTVIGCEIRNCTTTAIDADCGSDAGIGRVVILGNRIYDSVLVNLSSTHATPASWPTRIRFEGNELTNTWLRARKTTRLSIQNNTFYSPADVANNLIFLENVQGALISGNRVVGGDQGIWIDGVSSFDIRVAGNELSGQVTRGIQASATVDALDGIVISGNTIRNAAGCGATYAGIITRSRTVAENNVVTLAAGVAAHAGLYLQNGAIVKGNVVRHGGATYALRIDGNSNFCDYNYATAAVSDGGTNSKTGNQVIT